jgi:hypothetical protein
MQSESHVRNVVNLSYADTQGTGLLRPERRGKHKATPRYRATHRPPQRSNDLSTPRQGRYVVISGVLDRKEASRWAVHIDPEARKKRDSIGKETARLRSLWAATEDVAGNPHDTSLGHDPGALRALKASGFEKFKICLARSDRAREWPHARHRRRLGLHVCTEGQTALP